MTRKPTDPIVELGWLATSVAAQRDGFLPLYRRIEQDGLPIIDDWGYLTPDLCWRHGRGMGESRLECQYSLELLQSACNSAVDAGVLKSGSASGTDFLNQIIKLKNERGDRFEPAPVCIFSPRIPDPYVRRAWLAALPGLLPPTYRLRLRRLEVDPALLMRIGYRMLVNEWTAHGPGRPQTAEALAIFGLGALGLFPRWRCAVCFRISMPGASRCWLHGQPELIRLQGKEHHSRNASAARLGSRVMKVLNWGVDEFLNPSRIDFETEQKTVAGILWGKQLGVDSFSIEFLQKELAKGLFPRVHELLGHRFTSLNTARALAVLRSKLDHNEWIVSSWYLRVFAAERWLEAAAALSPGRTQSQIAPQTVELVKRARALVDQGLKQKEVADLLKIKRPYLSRLLKRFPPV